MLQMRKQLCVQVLRHNAHITLDMVIKHQTRRQRWLVLSASTDPSLVCSSYF